MSVSLYRGALVKVSSGGTNRDRQSHGGWSHSQTSTIHNVINSVCNTTTTRGLAITEGPRDALYQLGGVHNCGCDETAMRVQ